MCTVQCPRKIKGKNVDHLFSLANAFIYRSFITIVRSSSRFNNNNNHYNENVLNLIKGLKKILSRKTLTADKKAIGFQLIKCLSIKNIEKQQNRLKENRMKNAISTGVLAFNGIKSISNKFIFLLFSPRNILFLFLPWKSKQPFNFWLKKKQFMHYYCTMGFCSVHRIVCIHWPL